MKKNHTVTNENSVNNEAAEIKERENHTKKPQNKFNKRTIWTLKITGITLVLAIVVSFITEITSSRSHIAVSFILLSLLIIISILSDAIGVAATACDPAPLYSMAARKIKGAKVAVKLVQNAEKVSNICGDVIGDMCGIISGSAAAAIVIKIAVDNPSMYIFSIIMSSVIAAITVGGKAFCKAVAIKNSKEIIMLASKVISIFYKPKKI